MADDGSQYPIEKMDAHRRAIRHLAVSVFVFSGDQLLLQRRARGKYHCGGLWANTCCSHPHWGEDIKTGAKRRLFEELGIDLHLTAASMIDYSAPVSNGLWENERVRIFYTEADRLNLTMNIDPNEVAEVRWASLPAIREDLTNNPAMYAPWFRIYMARWWELGIQIS